MRERAGASLESGFRRRVGAGQGGGAMTRGYRIYGSFDSRGAVALSGVLAVKGLNAEWIEPSASLAWVLEARSGFAEGPYLRTPEGFLLGDVHAILDWLERAHPKPALLPTTPVRSTCARLLEDWIEGWLSLWPRRSWTSIEALGAHLDRSRFLLGRTPTRPDWLLAAWLETDVLVRPDVRAHLSHIAPRLVALGNDLLDAVSTLEPCAEDDAVPISLLGRLEEIGRDYHGFLAANQAALKDGRDFVELNLGLGPVRFRTRADLEARRVSIADSIRERPAEERRVLRVFLEAVGAWDGLTLPAIPERLDPADPRSL